MNNPFKKVAEPTECVCNRSDGLFVPSRQVSMLIAALLMMFFITFLSGYFFGKKHMVEQFIAKVEQDSFADQIYSSLCALSEYEPEELRAIAVQDQELVVQEIYDTLVQEVVPETVVLAEAAVSEDAVVSALNEPDQIPLPENPVVDTPPDTAYYAQLIGYGTELAAKKFAHRLSQKDIPVRVKKRISKTPKGRQRTWFQVVTQNHSDRDTLDKLVDRITKQEKLKGVCIVTC